MTTARIDLRIVILLFAVPLLYGLHSAAWYATRAMRPMALIELGIGYEQLHWVYLIELLGLLGGAIAAAVLGAALTGWLPLTAGLLIAGMGLAMGGLLDVSEVPLNGLLVAGLASLVAGFGRGMLTVGALSTLADGLRGSRVSLKLAAFALLYGAMNLGALTTSALSFVPGKLLLIAVLAGLSSALSAVLAAVVGAAWYALREHFPEPDPRRETLEAAPVAVCALLCVYSLFPYAAMMLGFESWSDLMFSAENAEELGDWRFLLNPLVVIATAGVLLVGYAGFYFAKIRLPTLLPAGIGMVVFGAATAVLVAVPNSDGALLASVIMAVGEALMIPALWASIGQSVHWRLVAPAFALWTFLSRSLGHGVSYLPDTGGAGPWVAAPVLVLFGLVAIAAALPLARRVWWGADAEISTEQT